jgi:voltage-gated potassium channel
LAFGALTVIFVVASSFTPDAWWIEALDVVFGLLFLGDFTARLLSSLNRTSKPSARSLQPAHRAQYLDT